MGHRFLGAFFSLCLAAWPCEGAYGADVVPIVSAKSHVKALNSEQVADIFLGKTSRFPDGTQATPIDQSEDSPAREKFYTQFTGKSPAQLRAYWAKIIFTGRGQPPRQVPGSAEAKNIGAQNPNAIAYIDARLVDDTVRVVDGR
jgi:ABC-type phosphate transport system substrate-binding protein